MARVASVTDFDHVTHGAPALRPQPSVCNFAGAARALFGRRDGTASVAILAAAYVSHPPVRGGVLDAPRLRDRRAALDAAARRGRLRTRLPRRARLCPPPNAYNSAGTACAPFRAGVRSCPLTHAGRAWKPAPTVGGEASCVHLRCTNPSVTARSAVTAPLSGEPKGGAEQSRCPSSHAGRAWKPAPTVGILSSPAPRSFFSRKSRLVILGKMC